MLPYRVSYGAVITKLVENNPKRPMTQAHKRFGHYRTGMTVQEFLDSGGQIGDIYYDIARSHIATSDFPYREIAERLRGMER